MHIVELVRLETHHEFGTIGILKIDKQLFCCTLEPSDKENARNISSIPTGQYICKLIHSPKYGHTYEVTNVHDRDDILFHSGNVIKHTLGCILLGQYPGKLASYERAVLNSGLTFKAFMNTLEWDSEFHLTVSEYY